MKRMRIPTTVLIAVAALLAGCASYTTPGGPVNLAGIDSGEIRDRMARQPASEFPALMTVVRVQSSNYRSMSAETYGTGAFAVVVSREFMDDDALETVAGWPGLRNVSPLSRLLLPQDLSGLRDLREASASLKADVLLVFTIDTSFRVDGKTIGPLSVVSLGLLRDRETVVTSTASAIFVDVRSGYVYGVAEASASESRETSAWGSGSAVDQSRLMTEREAFDDLLGEAGKTWRGLVSDYADNAS